MILRLYHYEILLSTLLFVWFLLAGVSESRAEDNVIAAEEQITYILQADKGELGSVKKTSETTYTATRVDDKVIATEMFGEHVSIDKASAPGVKPYYRSWEPEDLFHTGSRICILDVPIEAGKQAKVTFASTIKWPQQFCHIYLRSPYFTRASTVKVIVPGVLASRYSVLPYRLPESMHLEKTTEKNGDVVYLVKATDRKPLKHDPGAPSLSIDCPQLIISGHFSDTDHLYSYLKSFTDTSGQDDEAVSKLSQRLVSGCTTPLDMIDSVASWVRQNIRYVAIENGEYALRPAAASEVLNRKYGDCKGSANLIKALLRHAGIDSRLVWVGTRDEVPTDWETNPSLMSGNHQIACAILPDTIVYIDGTATWAPDGYIPENIRGVKVLVVNDDNCMLTVVPDKSRGMDGESLKAHLSVKGNDLVGTLSRTYSGTERAGMVSAWVGFDVAGRHTFLERLLTYPKKNLSADNPRLELKNASAAECTLTADKVVDRQAARIVGDKLYVGLQPLRLIGLDPVPMGQRTQGLRKTSNSHYSAEIVLDIPENYSVETLPQPFSIKNEWFDGDISYQVSESEIVCNANLRSGHDEVPFDRLEEYNNIIKALNKASNSQLILRRHEK